MIAICMAYYDRKPQLMKTLATMRLSAVPNYRVVITDDASPDPLTVEDDRVHIIRVEPEEKRWTNNDPVYNVAIKWAMDNLNPSVIILQNPECYHVGDVIDYADRFTGVDEYLSFSAFSLNKDITFSDMDISQIIWANDRAVSYDFGLGWYNHPKKRPVAYEFCSAIMTANMRRLNGYDERFSQGLAYGDNYLIHRIRCMGLKVRIVETPFVVHQWHDRNLPPNAGNLTGVNAKLNDKLSRSREYRAVHTITPDL